MKDKYYIIPIALVLLGIYFCFRMTEENEKIAVLKVPTIDQRVNILTSDKQSTLEYKWILENEEALKAGQVRFADNPYNEDKTIYQLKTSMDSLSSFVYGNQNEIERERCKEYNRFIEIRKILISLNKPTNCK